MKRTLLTILACALALTGCAQKGEKVLVAYFSATGTTAKVAANLAEATGATLYEIQPEVRYTDADLDWRDQESRSSLAMKDATCRPAIVKDLQDAASYSTVYVGFPVWWGTAPREVNTFMESYDFSGKTVILFATSGGSDLAQANADFKTAYPALVWKDGKVLANDATVEDLKAWVASLQQ
mgnify:CR=1 FL=1